MVKRRDRRPHQITCVCNETDMVGGKGASGSGFNCDCFIIKEGQKAEREIATRRVTVLPR